MMRPERPLTRSLVRSASAIRAAPRSIRQQKKEIRPAIEFPRGKVAGSEYDFTFSGIKSSVLNYLNRLDMMGEKPNVPDVAASFQQAVVDVLVSHAMAAVENLNNGNFDGIPGGEETAKAVKEALGGRKITKFAIAGGVASNSSLRAQMKAACDERGLEFHCPPPILCTDNAAMIGCAAYYEFMKGRRSGYDLNAMPNLRLGDHIYD